MISVLVAVYNVADYLPRLIDSVINQTYKDLEIILVDDGSTDGSEKICDEYARRDERISVIHTENGGLPSARNVGLRAATGDYILMVDGDDALHPRMIEILHKLITSGDYDFSMCYGEQVYDASLIEAKQTEEIDTSGVVELTQDDCMRYLHCRESIQLDYDVVWTKLYTKGILENMFFINTPSEDTEFNNRVYLRVDKAILLPQKLYYYVQRPTSVLHQGVNARFVNIVHSAYICLNEVPKENRLYRAYCLQHLYRWMASRVNLSRHTPWHQVAVENSKALRAKTIRELLLNPYISLFDKVTLPLRTYIPVLYTAFIYVNEFVARIKRS